MMLIKLLLVFFVLQSTSSQVTKKENALLSRKKRYLTFPDGSNFVITMSLVKGMMIDFPKSVNIIGECDVPFKLPSDTRWFKKKKHLHHIQKRDVYSTLELALNEHGFNGTACVKRLICDAKSLILQQGKSLIKDILLTVFTFEDNTDEDHNFRNFCEENTYVQCKIPLLKYILGDLNIFKK